MGDLPSRVAVLEHIASDIRDTLKDIRSDAKEMRSVHDRDFRLTFGVLVATALGLAALMARGFRWF